MNHQEIDTFYRTVKPQGGSHIHLHSETAAFAAVPVWTQQQRQGESGSKGKRICWLFFPYKHVITVKWLITFKYLQTSCAVIIKQRGGLRSLFHYYNTVKVYTGGWRGQNQKPYRELKLTMGCCTHQNWLPVWIQPLVLVDTSNQKGQTIFVSSYKYLIPLMDSIVSQPSIQMYSTTIRWGVYLISVILQAQWVESGSNLGSKGCVCRYLNWMIQRGLSKCFLFPSTTTWIETQSELTECRSFYFLQADLYSLLWMRRGSDSAFFTVGCSLSFPAAFLGHPGWLLVRLSGCVHVSGSVRYAPVGIALLTL